MLRKPVLSFAVCALMGAFAVNPAEAVPITVLFSGTITSVTDPGGFLDPSIVVGSPFSGSYGIEPSYGFAFPFAGGIAYDPAGSIDASIAGVPFSNSVAGVFVADGFTGTGGGDLWTLPISGSPIGAILVAASFQDTTGAKLASDDFFVNQDLAGWDLPIFSVSRITDGGIETLALGTIEAIPEPATGVLLGSGLLLVGAGRRFLRRRHLHLE